MALSTTYVKDEQGATFIAESQRPDGTWRKRRRVKDGYVPQEEVPLYESKGRQFAKNKPIYPVGYSPEMIAEEKAKKEKLERAKAKAAGTQGGNSSESKSNKKKKKKKNNTSASVDTISETLAKTQISTKEVKPTNKQVKPSPSVAVNVQTGVSGGSQPSVTQDSTPADPAKRVKNLRKRIREIEAIEQKIASGDLKTPEKDQLDKVARKKEIQNEIERLLPMLNAT